MPDLRLTIDGREIAAKPGQSVLEAALAAGVYIAHLCHHHDLPSAGSCRLCVVEIDGRDGPVTSCSTPVEDGMSVSTKTARVKALRRQAAELMLAPHPSECTSCTQYLKCELQSLILYLEVTDQHYRKRPYPIEPVFSNPLVLHDFYRCVMCGRCTRACTDLRGVDALTVVREDGYARIAPRNGSLADSGCKFCGACIEVCPTGAIIDQIGVVKMDRPKDAALVPCRAECPAGIDIPRYIRLVKEGRPAEANAVVREKVPFPSVLGYICNHVCETVCRRKEVDEAVSIKELKRYAAANDDGSWRAGSFRKPATGRRVAVIGSGPAGLTAAFYLAKLGHSVVVHEALPVAGGMMRVGIPGYRLPADILEGEIAEVAALGVEIRTDAKVENAPALLQQGYDAVLAAVGTHQGARLPIPGCDLDNILINTDFLRRVALGEKVPVGERVVVLGGGNVAFDCAGAARRLGAKSVTVVCLEARNEMKASPEEIDEALEEGTTVHASVTFQGITGENGRVTGVKCSKVCSFHFDEQGRAQIVCEIGSEHVIEGDTIIFAVGQRPDIGEGFGLPLQRGNRIAVDRETLATSLPGVFAAGDAVIGTASVIEAIAAGRRAASSIDRYFGGDGEIGEVLAPVRAPNPFIGREEGFACVARRHPETAPVDARDLATLVDKGYDLEGAGCESGRCLQCDLRLGISREKLWGEYDVR